jgi:hypothetical protein
VPIAIEVIIDVDRWLLQSTMADTLDSNQSTLIDEWSW